jgi:hypothetical protein
MHSSNRPTKGYVVAGCVEVTEKGDLCAVVDDFSADVQDEGD